MVPEGWEGATLGELVRLQRGHDLPAHVRADGNIEVIGGGGPNGHHDTARAPAPGIVIGRSGSGIGNAWWSDKPFWPLNTGMYVTDFLGNDPHFCFLWLDWIDFRSHNSGGAQPSLNRNFIYPIPIPLPPLPEQRKIADILSTWDRAIEVSESLLATARQQKRALMQTLLTGKRRFPEFEGQKWKEVRLGEVCETWSGGTPSRRKAEYYSGSIPWIKSGEVNAIRVEATEEHITQEALKCSSAKLVEPETVLIAMYGATAGVVSVSGIHAAINQAILAVKANAKLESNFLLFAVQGKMEDTKRITQGGQPNLNAQIIRAAKIPLPCLQEQRQIAKILGASQREIELGCQKIQHLRTEKRALMQQLLTGKRRVVV